MTTLQLDKPTHFIQKPVKGFGNLFVYDLRKRWLPGILEIEADSTENFWGRADFLELMINPNVRGYVAVKLHTVAGFIMYEGEYDHYNILNLGVHDKFRRRGIGSLLLDRMKDRLERDEERDHLRFDVRETNLPTQLFLRNNGFLATGVLKRYFKDYWTEDGPPEVEDAYNFCFRGN